MSSLDVVLAPAVRPRIETPTQAFLLLCLAPSHMRPGIDAMVHPHAVTWRLLPYLPWCPT